MKGNYKLTVRSIALLLVFQLLVSYAAPLFAQQVESSKPGVRPHSQPIEVTLDESPQDRQVPPRGQENRAQQKLSGVLDPVLSPQRPCNQPAESASLVGLESIKPIALTDWQVFAISNSPELVELKVTESDWHRGYVTTYANTTARMLVLPLSEPTAEATKILLTFFDPNQPHKQPGFLLFKSTANQASKATGMELMSKGGASFETLDGETVAIGRQEKGVFSWSQTPVIGRSTRDSGTKNGLTASAFRWDCFRGCFATIRLTANCVSQCAPCTSCLRFIRSLACAPFCLSCVLCIGGAALGCWRTCS